MKHLYPHLIHTKMLLLSVAEQTINQAISYLLVVWVLYSPLFPIIALPW